VLWQANEMAEQQMSLAEVQEELTNQTAIIRSAAETLSSIRDRLTDITTAQNGSPVMGHIIVLFVIVICVVIHSFSLFKIQATCLTRKHTYTLLTTHNSTARKKKICIFNCYE